MILVPIIKLGDYNPYDAPSRAKRAKYVYMYDYKAATITFSYQTGSTVQRFKLQN